MFIVSAIPLVNLPLPKDQVFSYFFSEHLKRGSLVELPFANRMVIALVLRSDPIAKKKLDIRSASFKLKGIHKIFNPNPIISEVEIELGMWLSSYLYSSMGLVFKTLIPRYLLRQAPDFYQTVEAYHPKKDFSFKYISGKARQEEYKKELKLNIKEGEQSLVLFPRALEAKNFFALLDKDIKKHAILWSSSLTAKKEVEERLKILTGETKVIIGTRGASLLYLPYLSTLILEDEYNYSHKSWDMYPRYDARVVSLHTAKERGAKLIWGGNIPSVWALDTLLKEGQKDSLLELAQKTKNKIASLNPPIVVDMKRELENKNFSPLSRALKDKLVETINSSKQAILLINRLGEFTVVLCRDCGFVLRCSNCKATLITSQSKQSSTLLCRYCATKQKEMDFCPNCNGHRFKKLGAGIQRVEQEIKNIFPNLALSRLDSLIAQTPKAQEEILERFVSGKTQVLIGTQMLLRPDILPKVKQLAIINLEAALLLPEYNGEEKVFQILSSLIDLSQNNVIWQTYQTEHPIVEFFAHKEKPPFLKNELALRKEFGWPPYVQVIKAVLYDKDKERGAIGASAVWDKLLRAKSTGIEIYEPIESNTTKEFGRYWWTIILKVSTNVSIEKRNEFLSYIPSKWKIDVDPVSIL